VQDALVGSDRGESRLLDHQAPAGDPGVDAFGQLAVEQHAIDQLRLVAPSEDFGDNDRNCSPAGGVEVINQRQGLGRVLDPVDEVHAHVVDQAVGGHHFLIRKDHRDGAHGRLPCGMHQGDKPVEARLKLLDDPSPAEQDSTLAGLDHDPEGSCHAIKSRRDGPGVLLSLLKKHVPDPPEDSE
jgi:hypothetical protein